MGLWATAYGSKALGYGAWAIGVRQGGAEEGHRSQESGRHGEEKRSGMGGRAAVVHERSEQREGGDLGESGLTSDIKLLHYHIHKYQPADEYLPPAN